MLQENNLAVCLKTGMLEHLPPRTRQSKVAKIAEWRALDKPWKSLLLICLHEVQIPDEEEGNSAPMMRNRRVQRGRRGAKTNSGPLEWLPKAEEVLIDDGSPAAYRLAVLLIRKTLYSDDWEESWDSILEGLREDAATQGVHPVWSKMAEATPILAQFAAFPQTELKEQEADKFDTGIARIDPTNGKSLAKALSMFEATSSDAKVKMALAKAIAQLNGKRGLRDISGLESLEGDSSIISVLLNIHLGNDANVNLKELSKSDAELADAFSDLLDLKNGKCSDWNTSRKLSGDDELSLVRKTAAWALLPDEAADLSSDELQIGLDLGLTPQQKETITWWKLAALVREGSSELALDLLTSLNVEPDAEMSTLIPLVRELGQDATEWLVNQTETLAEEGLSSIVNDTSLGADLRSAAARKLHDNGASFGIDASIDLFSRNLDLKRLAEVLFVDEHRCIEHPYATLLVAHLLPAKTKG